MCLIFSSSSYSFYLFLVYYIFFAAAAIATLSSVEKQKKSKGRGGLPVLPGGGRRHSGVRHALFHARTGGAQRVGGRHRLADRPRRSLPGRRGPLVWTHTKTSCMQTTLPTYFTYLPIYLTYIISSQPASQPNKQTNTGHCLRHLNERRRSGNLNGTNPFSSIVIPTQK